MRTFPEPERVVGAYGGSMALYPLPGALDPDRPVVLVAHGTISNVSSVQTLGFDLAEQGFAVWLLGWGGHGASTVAPSNQDFEHPALYKLPRAIDHVLKATGAAQLAWVSHSGGGHLPLMWMARDPEAGRRFSCLTLLGAQSTEALPTWKGRLYLATLWLVSSVLGWTPSRFLPPGCESEPSRLLVQWAMWNLRGRWRGADGFDYDDAMRGIHVPALMLAGAGDAIAPPEGVRKIFDAFGAADKKLIIASLAQGHARDYTHGGLVLGDSARRELFPLIGDWIAEHG